MADPLLDFDRDIAPERNSFGSKKMDQKSMKNFKLQTLKMPSSKHPSKLYTNHKNPKQV